LEVTTGKGKICKIEQKKPILAHRFPLRTLSLERPRKARRLQILWRDS